MGAGAYWRPASGAISDTYGQRRMAVLSRSINRQSGKMELTPAWLSRDMMTPSPRSGHGIVFVLAAGEFTGQANDVDGGLYSWQDRVNTRFPPSYMRSMQKPGKNCIRVENR